MYILPAHINASAIIAIKKKKKMLRKLFQSVVLNYVALLRLVNVIFISKYFRIENACFPFNSKVLEMDGCLFQN